MSIFRKKQTHKTVSKNRRITKSPKDSKVKNSQKKTNPKIVKSDKRSKTNRRRETIPPAMPPDEPVESATPEASEPNSAIARIAGYIFKFLLFSGIVTGTVLGGRLIYTYGTTSAQFAIKYIEIQGNERLTNSEVIESAGFAIGDNIFLLDLLQIQKNIKKNPWIVNATVQQRLPSTILIEVVEREVEMMVLFDVPYIVDSSGEIFKRWQSGDPMPRVILTGISKQELYEDAGDVEKVILDGVALKNLYRKMGAERLAPLIEIHREPNGDFSLTVGKELFYIHFGRPPYRKKLVRLVTLIKKMSKSKTKPAIIYFDNRKRPDRITVKLKIETSQKKMNKKMPKN